MKTASKLSIVVLGYVVRGPLGGLCWHHAQYARGLKDLGHDVLFVEDSGDSEYCCYDPLSGLNGRDPAYGVDFARDLFASLEVNWAYHDRHTGSWIGPAASRVLEVCREADVVINVSLANDLEYGLEQTPIRIAVDTDPVFTQIRNLTDAARRRRTSAHNQFFSFGANLRRSMELRDGFDWRPTRQPVVLRLWPVTPPLEEAAFTTVMQWDSYPSREWNGQRYGQKSKSFGPFMDFPRRVSEKLEIVLGSKTAPRDQLRMNGWTLRLPNEAVRTPRAFQEYVSRSKAEFSIAKHGYVVSNSGWFGDRTAAYLASGRPAVIENTGFSDWLHAPGGVLSFRTPEEAAEQIDRVRKDYSDQCRMARRVAEDYFNAAEVLGGVISSAV